MAYCAVKGCKNNTKISYHEKNMSFHIFPREENNQNQWLTVLGIDNKNWKWSKNRVVCSEHFRMSDFIQIGRTRLKANVVPSLNLDLTPKYTSPIRVVRGQKNKILDVGHPSSICSDEPNYTRIKNEIEELSTLGNRQLFFSNEFEHPLTVNMKNEISALDGENIKTEPEINKEQEYERIHVFKDYSSHDSISDNQNEEYVFSDDLEQPVAIYIKNEIDSVFLEGDNSVEGIKIESDLEGVQGTEYSFYVNQNQNATNEIIRVDHKNDEATSEIVQPECGQCQFCDFTTSNGCKLNRHIDTVHYRLKNHKCEHCDYTTSQAYNLKKHMETVHRNIKNCTSEHYDDTVNDCQDIKPQMSNFCHGTCEYLTIKPNHVCTECNYSTRYISHLKRHNATVHRLAKAHECVHCDYTTDTYVQLKQHIVSNHDKINRYEHCDNGSSYLSAFIDYINTNQR